MSNAFKPLRSVKALSPSPSIKHGKAMVVPSESVPQQPQPLTNELEKDTQVTTYHLTFCHSHSSNLPADHQRYLLGAVKLFGADGGRCRKTQQYGKYLFTTSMAMLLSSASFASKDEGVGDREEFA